MDKKAPLLNLEEKSMMEASCLLKKDKEVLFPLSIFFSDYKTVAQ